jgi:peptidyl-prolyl cis-trans isomerase D
MPRANSIRRTSAGFWRPTASAKAEFIASQRQEMLSGAISDALGSGIAPPRPLVEALWQFQSERRDAQYFEVDAGDVTVPAPTEGVLRQFYEENPSLFEIPERREIALIHADPVELGSRVEISEDASKRPMSGAPASSARRSAGPSR